MTETEERVARAICRANRITTGFQESPDYTLENEIHNAWDLFVPEPRAAIAAMREPTEEQYDALCGTDKMWRELDSKTVWQTYIDAALGVHADG